VHISAVEKAGLPGLDEGQVVEYEEVPNRGSLGGKSQGSALKAYSSARSIPSLQPVTR
jgi:cold shock CspA family protein